MLSFGDPAPFGPAIKEAGAVLICQVQSLAHARYAVAAGADILVAQGTEAGGHGQTTPLFSLLPQIVQHFRGASAAGGGSRVLGSPIAAFGYLVRELDRFGSLPLQTGDVVTTGTLTEALPARSGQRWSAHVQDIPLEDTALTLE
jgi:hypothetical protein